MGTEYTISEHPQMEREKHDVGRLHSHTRPILWHFIHAYINLPTATRPPERKAEDRCRHVRVVAIGESDGEDAGKEGVDPAPTGAAAFTPDSGSPKIRDSGRGTIASRRRGLRRDPATNPAVLSRPLASPPANLYVLVDFLTTWSRQ